MRERHFELLAFLSIAALCGWLVRCLRDQQQETMETITKATSTISQQATEQMASMTQAFTTATSEVTGKVSGLAETLILGRDSPSPSESLPTNSTESESWTEPEIELSDLPETARLAAEEEELVQRTEMPWQSSPQPNDLD